MTDSIPSDAERLRLSYDKACAELPERKSCAYELNPCTGCRGDGTRTIHTNIELERIRIDEIGYESVTFRPDIHDADLGWSGLLREVE